MDVRQLGEMGLVIVVAAITLSIGAALIGGLATTQCTGTFITNTSRPTTATLGVNPANNLWYGCCSTITGADNNCTNWDTSAKANASVKGLASMTVFGDWIPLIALVIVASIVIGVIVSYLGKSSGSV
jgi:hypothetical protein